MKVLILKKNTLIITAILVLTIIGFMAAGLFPIEAITTAGEGKILPIYSVQKEDKVISISFDAAWGNEDLGAIMKTLEDYNVKTTFFCVGSFIDKYPDSVRELYDKGHEIVNHSNTHAHMSKLEKSQILKELQDCDTKIKKVTGEILPLFRPPYGEYNNLVVKTAREAGYFTIQWDVDSLDWKNLSVEEIVKRVTTKVKPGSIVLFHNGTKNTATALPLVLEKLQTDGYKIVPVSQLILTENYTIDHTGKQIPNT